MKIDTKRQREEADYMDSQGYAATADMLNQSAAEIDRLRGVLAECRIILSDSAKVHRLFKNPGRSDVIEDFISEVDAALADGEGVGK